MALYRIDGFDYYPSTGSIQVNAEADGWYSGAGNLQMFPGRFNKGLSMGFGGSVFNEQAYEAIGKRWTTQTTVIGQAIFWPSGGGSGFQLVINDAEGGTGPQFYLQFETLGVIRLFRSVGAGGSGGAVLIATTPAKAWHVDEWNYIELKFKVHPTAGTMELRVNKVVVLSYVGNTANTVAPVLSMAYGWDSMWWSGSLSSNDDSNQLRWDDRYILDDTGSNNTDYLGNVRVNTQLTTAPGDLTEMSVFGASANWDAVNESALTEAEYVFSSLVGARDLYTMDPNVTAQNIFGVQVTGAFRQDDSTQMKAHNLVKTHGTLYESAVDQYLAQTYHYYRDMWELNPNTGVGWTAAELNAIQAGQKLLAG
jgi:hypothetical protein